MTDNQKFGFYLPVWNRLKDKMEWYRPMRRTGNNPRITRIDANSKQNVPTLGEVLARQEVEFRGWPEPAGPAALQVLTIARQTAMQRAGAPVLTREGACAPQVTAEDLRRACTFVATVDLGQKGYNSTATNSTKHLNNIQVNHLDTLLKLLMDHDNLKWVTWWLHPEMREKEGLIDRISRMAPEGTLRAIFAECYGTKEWRDGDKQRLVWLLKQVKGRTKKFREPVDRGIHGTREMELEPLIHADER